MAGILESTLSRRRFLGAAGAMLGGAAVSLANTECAPVLLRQARRSAGGVTTRDSVWVWQFSIDGPAGRIADDLAANSLAAVVKTHDGVEWMATYDTAPGAIGGPADVEATAATFEDAGVPFHAWCVVKGIDLVREARMAADVLDAGARSITFDLESGDGFWAGTNEDAQRFGDEFRSRAPDARADITIDPRPWRVLHVPLHQFAAFTDGVHPQIYWDAFDTVDNRNAYRYMGFPTGDDGISPEFLLDATQQLLAPLGRPIIPIASGAPADPAAFARFVRHARELSMPEAGVWRYGIVTRRTLDDLAADPAAGLTAGG